MIARSHASTGPTRAVSTFPADSTIPPAVQARQALLQTTSTASQILLRDYRVIHRRCRLDLACYAGTLLLTVSGVQTVALRPVKTVSSATLRSVCRDRLRQMTLVTITHASRTFQPEDPSTRQ
eukprot:08606_3